MKRISYSGYRFPPEIIQQGIWLYLRFTLSLRDVEDLLALGAACGALNVLASVNSEHTGRLAKVVAMVCRDCQKECEKWPKVIECKTCGDACKACAAECDK